MTQERPAGTVRALATAAAFAGLVACSTANALPSFKQIKVSYLSSDTVILDRNGTPLQRVRSDMKLRRLEWIPLSEVSPAFRQALLLSEDRRFYQHSGVDWPAVGAAAWNNLWNSRSRGASTLTMQLAGLLDPELSARKGGRSLSVKAGQMRTAWQLEHAWEKDQILEAYLNLVPFRGEIVGIGAMSATLFGKYPSGLDADESAIAVSLLRAPNVNARVVAQHACALLAAQRRRSDCSLFATYTAQVLATRSTERMDPDAQLAPHFARYLLSAVSTHSGAPQSGNLRSGTAESDTEKSSTGKSDTRLAVIDTTLDSGLQRFARDTLRRHLSEESARHVEDGAVIVIDNASGNVLAWVGSSGDLSQAAAVDGVTAPRQAGSTLKPFLYEIALEERWLTAASILDDSPVGLSTAAGLYVPQNYERDFKGLVSLRTALGSSLNVPAVRTLVMVTPERFAERLRKLGIGLAHNGDYYGYSLALGSPEVTLSSLANAYRALANGGRSTPIRTRPADPVATAVSVMNPAASFIVADILADREARVVTFGLDNALAARYWAAVKTGTSKDMRDNWCVGFSRSYTVGVWVGNANGEPMWNVSGVTGAAPVWRAVMDELHRRDSADGAQWRAPAAPAGLSIQNVEFESLREPQRNEWFMAGTEQSKVRLASSTGGARALIASPTPGTVIALDPDIPGRAQHLRIASVRGTPNTWSWRMDGKRLGPAVSMPWPLWPGPHRLELVDAAGRVVEASRFEVRGVELKRRGKERFVRNQGLSTEFLSGIGHQDESASGFFVESFAARRASIPATIKRQKADAASE